MLSSNVRQKETRGAPKGNLIDGVLGRIRDVDTHEMYPARLWVQEYGEVVAPLAAFFIESQAENIPNSFSVSRCVDEDPITREKLPDYWGSGCLAAGAFDMKRRLEFMDLAGIDESLVFGSMMAVIGQQFATDGGEFIRRRQGKLPFDDPEALGSSMVTAHNDWCIRIASLSPRLRPVAAILTRTLQEAVDESERVLAAGVRAVTLPAGAPIEGRAPAHPENDRLWQFYADNKIPVLLHIGSEKAFLREATAWGNAPQFATNTSLPSELSVDPFNLATSSLAAQTYIINLTLGAVFERVPELRIGTMELSGHWVGSTAANMDLWVEQFARRFQGVLSMKPSEYVARNVRVSPFPFEPVDTYIDKYPFLKDVYCFSTDYPHFEGGKDPIGAMARRMERLGGAQFEKFFVRNAAWIMT